jgi:hypothetical protein
MSDMIRFEVAFHWRKALANSVIGVWFVGSLTVVSFMRAFEMHAIPLLWIFLALISATLAVIPMAFIRVVLKQYRSDRWGLIFLLAISPALLAEAWFLSEEISFRFWVSGQLEQMEPGEEIDLWRSRRYPFDEFSMGYDEEGYWVMD